MHTAGLGIWRENWKTWNIENKHSMTWNMARNTEKSGKWETQTLGPRLWRENWKTWKMRNTGYSTRNMARKLKNEENKHTLQNLECGEKTEKRGKWDTNTVWPGTWQETLTNLENEKCTLYDLEYGKKYEKRGKWEMHSVESGMWRKTLKNVEIEKHTM